MSLKTLYITGVPGLSYVQHPELGYCEVMMVAREGKPLVETTALPIGRQFRHNPSGSRIELPISLRIGAGPENNPAVDSDVLVPEKFIIEIKVP